VTDFEATRYTIDSALELVADHWDAGVPNSSLFRNSSSSDRITLAPGLLSGTSPVVITAIQSGVIDEYELTITPTNIAGRIRGRDPSALILDGFVDVGFARPPEASLGAAAVSETLPGFDFPTVVATFGNVGRSLASEIAREVVELVGLTLSWECRDYEVATTFQASGRVVDVLRKLVEPWTLVEPFKVDIYLEGSTVIVRHRQLPGQPLVADAEHTMTLLAARRSQVMVRKRRFKKIGKVTLNGRASPQGLGGVVGFQLNEGGGGGGGTQTIEYVNEAFDNAGVLTQRTVIQDKFRTPDRILLETIKSTFTRGESGPLILTTRETIENKWDPSIYDETGPINVPKQRSQSIVREILDTETGIFREDGIDETTYTYDDVGFLVGETTVTRKFNAETNFMDLNVMSVKTVHDMGPVISEQIVETYRHDSEVKRWIIQARTTTLGGGYRPGGPGRLNVGGQGVPLGGGDTAFGHFTLERIFSPDLDAEPIEYTNENLSPDDLQFIMDQFAAAIGLMEYEFKWDGVAMPWIKRGASIKFVNVLDENGVDFNFPTAVITEVNTQYDESSKEAKFMTGCRAFAWALQ